MTRFVHILRILKNETLNTKYYGDVITPMSDGVIFGFLYPNYKIAVLVYFSYLTFGFESFFINIKQPQHIVPLSLESYKSLSIYNYNIL